MTTVLKCAFCFLAVWAPAYGWAAERGEVRQELAFPNLPGLQTLACDLHMHTVFSDGEVWPSVRVAEAWRLGLDAIAITDHIEYQPHKTDVPTNFNRSYDLATGPAKAHRLLLIRAAEITRDTPPGHFNTLFLDDIAPLDTPEFVDAVRQANKQGAFVFWNHHAWKGEEKGAWLEVHTTLFNEKLLHGMEVANGDDYYPQAHRWCLEKKLTMVGNSDIHAPDLNKTTTSAEHRTLTLILARERTLAGLKEALKAGQTIVWYKEQLIGREELLRPFFSACLEVQPPTLRSKTSVTVPLCNKCPADIRLERKTAQAAQTTVLPGHSTTLLRIPVADGLKQVKLSCTATNFLIGPEKQLSITLTIPAP